jgi:hypothetical protein
MIEEVKVGKIWKEGRMRQFDNGRMEEWKIGRMR